MQTDWTTFQGNAGHTGFVDVTLDPTKFAKAWSWSRPVSSEPIGAINSVATGDGLVYVSNDVYSGNGEIYALNETDGSSKWTYSFDTLSSEGPPAYSNGTVFVQVTSSNEECAVWAVDALTGVYKFKSLFGCQWSNFFAPTVFDNSVLTDEGAINSYSTVDGSTQWSAQYGSYDQSTPAADDKYVYSYCTLCTNGELDVIDRNLGTHVASIADPASFGQSGSYSQFSAPMVGTMQDVISFSGGGFSGRAASSSEQYDSRVLVSYDINGKKSAWQSQIPYFTHPAVANGVVYAASNSPLRLDALSEADGHVLWSWTPPSGDLSFHRNIVVTDNLLFVSTDANVYAVDLSKHTSVWQYPAPGMLAISSSGILYIVTGAALSDGNLVAIKLY